MLMNSNDYIFHCDTILFNITDEISRTMAARNGIGVSPFTSFYGLSLRIEPHIVL